MVCCPMNVGNQFSKDTGIFVLTITFLKLVSP
jgi:hypothetical protein